MKIARYFRNLLLAAVVLAVPAASFAGIFISVGIAPPPLPVYEQPPIPGDGYLWTPGYWAWSDDGGYYWVPGTWVQPPQVGFLWTPGYWGWNNGFYAFNAGYWGPHIGFYGGVNYGFGYGGVGYEGGYWDRGHFAYNRSVTNVTNVHVTNVYNKTVINNVNVDRTSFNGGTGGIQARPTAQEQAAVRENHVPPTTIQQQHVTQAQTNPQLRASVNGGKPAIAATARPADFKSAVPARQAGGQVNTAVYKAAAENKGKLPPNMKDPGSVPANHAANTPAARPVTPTATTGRPATPEIRPAPGTPAANTSRPAVNNRPTPAPAAPASTRPEPATRPQPVARPEQTQQPRPPTQPNYSQPRPEQTQQPRPPTQPNYSQPRPEPQPRPQAEPRPQPQARPESQPRPESRPPAEHSAPHESPRH
ncbi:Glycoprotein X precursor [Acidisarcina polymorpha]|uniref:Glycoprotein X n=1 Tax=Acidisarcina polymorpha TaxID=2211140 RepID=A0A2Z5FVX6_9BACT|nr:YXWGXW repeat-containing protein [Acidisarcina polymorpha]AXC10566.1 Glycoprotein X precursor [Acidisarcina polymorpha]